MDTSELKRKFVQDARNATTPGERGEVVRYWADLLDKSTSTLQRWLRDAGVKPTRVSAGGRRAEHTVSDQTMEKIIGLMHTAKRKTGKATLCYEDAIMIAENMDWLKKSELTVPQLRHWASTNGLLQRDIMREKPTHSLYSEYPNQVHQLDWSVCLQYDFGDKGKPMNFLSYEMALEKNKITDTIRKRKTMIWRGIMIDHYSNAFYLRYYEVPGESAKMTLDFLTECWFPHKKEGFIFHGLPEILLTDKGPGHTAQVIQNLCTAYEIKFRPHKAGSPNVKGAVEKMHDIVECRFESLLKFRPAHSLQELNKLADDFQIKWNSQRIHSRHHQPRFKLWQSKIGDHLYVPDSVQQFHDAARTDPIERLVDKNGMIHWKNTLYRLPDTMGDLVGKKVSVIVMPKRLPALGVGIKGQFYLAYPIKTNEAGFRSDAKLITKVHRTIVDKPEQFRRDAEERELPIPRVNRLSDLQRHQVAVEYPLPAASVRKSESIVIVHSVNDAVRMISDTIGSIDFVHLQNLRADLIKLDQITDDDIYTLIEHYTELTRPSTGYAAG